MLGYSDSTYLRLAYYASLNSDDGSTKNGAVIVGSAGAVIGTGYNSCIRNLENKEERLAKNKYYYYVHAEEDAICRAACNQCDLNGSTMFALWAACAACARLIALVGITRVVTIDPRKYFNNRWLESIEAGNAILKANNVEVHYVDLDHLPAELKTLTVNGINIRG